MPIFLNKSDSSPGTREKLSTMALLIPVMAVTAFPAVAEDGVTLSGDIAYNKRYATVLYISRSSQEYSLEPVGESDARAFRLKFTGTHPGRGAVALEFVRDNLDADFIVVLLACGSGQSRVLGTPCAPLTLQHSHKSGKDGAKFEITLEQEEPTENVYFFTSQEFAPPLFFSGTFYMGSNYTYTVRKGLKLHTGGFYDGDPNGLKLGDTVTLIGQDDVPGTESVILCDGAPDVLFVLATVYGDWRSYVGSSITFKVMAIDNDINKIQFFEIYRT